MVVVVVVSIGVVVVALVSMLSLLVLSPSVSAQAANDTAAIAKAINLFIFLNFCRHNGFPSK